MMICEQVLEYLESLSLCTFSSASTSSNAFIDYMPENPTTIVCAFNRSGVQYDSSLGYPKKGVQIIYRGTKNPMDSAQKAEAIFKALHGFAGLFKTGGNRIVSCLSQNGGAYSLGPNKNCVFEYTMNFLIEFKE